MSLWFMLAAPLLAGNDLRDVTKPIMEILTKSRCYCGGSGRGGEAGAADLAGGPVGDMVA
jgi:hypothetical protein